MTVPGEAAPDGGPPADTLPGDTRPPRQPAAATGDARVDDALQRLDDLAALSLPEHVAVFEHIHAELTAALGTLDAVPDRTPPAAHGHTVTPAPPES